MRPTAAVPPPYACALSGAGGRRARAGGSVLVVVLVTVMFAVSALLLFVERAGDDLLVEARAADAARLRAEAYSALETTLAVLVDFRLTGGGALRSPAEGWGDPLAWSGYAPGEGRTVEVAFADESGKLPLPNTDFPTLVALFVNDGLAEPEAERLADALLGWARPDYVAASVGAPRPDDYARAPLPFAPPGRSLRSFDELAAIDVAREVFFDETGRPNERWARFVAAVSLFAYPRPNLNSAGPAVLAALGRYTETQQRQLGEFFEGAGAYALEGPGYFRDPEEAGRVLGAQAVAPGFGTEIRTLRIGITVREGRSSFYLEAVVAPPGGATAVRAVRSEAEGEPAPAAGETPSLEYPFTLLEIRENDAMPLPPVAALGSP